MITTDIHKAWLQQEYGAWAKALQDSTVNNFKDNPIVTRMLGDVDRDIFKSLVPDMHAFKTLDNIGRTVPLAQTSGTALRMVYYAMEVLARHPTNIIEIGGGVGQFYATLRILGYSGYYYIWDLIPVQEFQRHYLAEAEKRLYLPMSPERHGNPDFCVSFYALGEFDDDSKRWYIENVVNKCKHGLIIWNPHSGATKDVPFECAVTDEYPSTYPQDPSLIKQLEW